MFRATALLRVFNALAAQNQKRTFATVFEEFSAVRYEKEKGENSGIAIVAFDSAKNKNALSATLVRELNSILDDIYYDSELRVVILRSLVEGVFCAGADLKERLKMPERQVFPFVCSLRNLAKRIYNVPIPVIAAIDGVALGGGFELALAADIRIASSNAKLGLVETKLAVIPGAGGTQLLQKLINPSIAKELIFTAHVLNAVEAKHLGILNHVIEQNERKDAAYSKSLELAKKILPNGPLAIKMAKRAVNSGHQISLEAGFAVEEACYDQIIPTKDRVEGLKAFIEKRPPVYKGE